MKEKETLFFRGLLWALFLSVPLWISLAGWWKVFVHFSAMWQ